MLQYEWEKSNRAALSLVNLEWPEAVRRVSMLLLILGLPLIITLAWYHGERASRHFSTAEMTIVSLLLVIGSMVFYAFVQPHQEVADATAPSEQQTGVEKARAAASTPAGTTSPAVLPFANLSGDATQEFFSDGSQTHSNPGKAIVPSARREATAKLLSGGTGHGRQKA
jgi:hypothetical protein